MNRSKYHAFLLDELNACRTKAEHQAVAGMIRENELATGGEMKTKLSEHYYRHLQTDGAPKDRIGKTPKRGIRYSEEMKADMVARMIGPGAISTVALSKEAGITQPTLSRWLKEAKSAGQADKAPEADRPEKKAPPAAVTVRATARISAGELPVSGGKVFLARCSCGKLVMATLEVQTDALEEEKDHARPS